MKLIDKAIAIIEATDDGDALHPRDLKIVEMGVNGYLNEEGAAYFEQLYNAVMAGSYVSPWAAPFWGIEELRIDATGYVYWRGVSVEHYEPGWCWTEAAHAQAEQLAAICRAIEADGLTVTLSEVGSRF